MTANKKKSYRGYLNKLIDKYNNTSHRSISKTSIDADYSDLTKEKETIPRSPKFKVGDGVRITGYNNIFSKGCTEN